MSWGLFQSVQSIRQLRALGLGYFFIIFPHHVSKRNHVKNGTCGTCFVGQPLDTPQGSGKGGEATFSPRVGHFGPGGTRGPTRDGGGVIYHPPHYFPHFCKRNHMKISSHSPRIPSEPIFPIFFGLGGPPGVPLGVVIHHLTLSSPFPSLL